MATETRRGRTGARRLLQSILAGQYAILPEWMDGFAGIARRMDDGDGAWSAEQIRAEIRQTLLSLMEDRPGGFRSVAVEVGSRLPGTDAERMYPPTMRDGVAIIPVIGPLYHYADEFTDVCGCSAFERIAGDIGAARAAAAAGLIGAVMFEVDSPGGEVGGCAETAGLIAHLAAEMPVRTYASDLMCSAGL
jgi:ClpP class serine protease